MWDRVPEPSADAYGLGHRASERQVTTGRVLYISSFAVDPLSRGGVGRPFFRDSIGLIRTHYPTLERIAFIVHADWLAARHIYEGEGFRYTGEIKGFFRTGTQERARHGAAYMKRPVIGIYAIAGIVIAIWGSTFISTKVLLGAFSPVEILVYRFIIAYLIMFALYPHVHRPEGFKTEISLALAGITGGTLYFLAENFALSYSYASNVALLVSTAPILTAILAHFFIKGGTRRERGLRRRGNCLRGCGPRHPQWQVRPQARPRLAMRLRSSQPFHGRSTR